MSVLYIVRGLPGSGKSTLASAMRASGMGIHIEADDFFVGKDGKYRFDAHRLKEAHAACLNRAKSYLADDCDVIVANTFTQVWEMQPYLSLATERTVVLTCEGDYGSVHGVPDVKIDAMRRRWERWPS